MPIRATAKANVQPLDNLEAFLNQFSDVAYDVWQDTVNDTRASILDELQDEPGSPQYPIEWASERQRKFVMAKLRREGNLPYRRTGKLANAWVVEAERNGSTFVMIIENLSNIAKYVYGSLAQNRNIALRFQQPFHRNTGWQAATDTAYFWIDAVFEDYARRIRNIATVATTKRAYTR